MKRRRTALAAGAAGSLVGVYTLATQPMTTSLVGIAGYVLGGALIVGCWAAAGFYWLRDVRGWRSPVDRRD